MVTVGAPKKKKIKNDRNIVPTHEQFKAANPNRPKTLINVKFGDGKKISINDTPVSEEEKRGFFSQSGGQITSKVSDLRIAAEKERLRRMAPPTTTATQTAQPTQQGEMEPLPTLEELTPTQKKKSFIDQVGDIIPQEAGTGDVTGSSAEVIAGKTLMNVGKDAAKIMSNALALVGQPTLNILDNFRASITGGDTRAVRDSKELFDIATRYMEDDIKKVSTGEKSYFEVLRNISRARGANMRLWSISKSKGLTDFRYRVRDGSLLEEEARAFDDLLNQMLVDLQNARVQAAMAPVLQEQELTQAATSNVSRELGQG